jgi:hypothetical protein
MGAILRLPKLAFNADRSAMIASRVGLTFVFLAGFFETTFGSTVPESS